MELQENKNTAIVTINYSAYSETFIQAQINLIPAKVILHSGGWKPMYYNEKTLIISSKKLRINSITKKLFKFSFYNFDNELHKILKKNKIQVILAQYGPAGVEMMDFCEKYNYKLIVHFHGFDASEYNTLNTFKSRYIELFRKANKIIAVSKRMKEDLINIGCNENKIELITYGPNEIFFNSKPTFTSNTFFSIGRFVNKKAPYLTIMAFYELLKEFPLLILRMAGEGELLNTCRNMVKAWGIEKNVEFIGIIKPEQTRQELENAIAYVQHSIIADDGDSEGTPLAILEAQASGIPIISTYHAGIPDVVLNMITGFLVDEKDIIAMKEAMKKIHLDRNFAQKMGIAGRNRIKENFTMENYISKLKNIINE